MPSMKELKENGLNPQLYLMRMMPKNYEYYCKKAEMPKVSYVFLPISSSSQHEVGSIYTTVPIQEDSPYFLFDGDLY